MQSWSPLQYDGFGTDKDKDSYLSTLTAFLAANPPGSLGALAPSTLSLSSPEGTDNSSPSSSSDSPNNAQNGSNPPSRSNTGGSSTGFIGNSNYAHNSNGLSRSVGASGAAPAQPGDKRKNETQDAALKDRRASTGGLEGGLHTHGGSDEDEDEDGKKGGKTSEKRRAQNRQAQRAFRERKEKHLKELEDRVYSLEQQTTDQDTENAALKQLLERLQNENERLKVYESAFSFTYDKDVSSSSSMPTATQFGGVNKPPTPPTASDELNFSLPPFSSASLFGTSATSTPPSFSSSPDAFALSTVPLPSSSNATGSGLDNPLFFGSLSAPSPASTTGDSTSGSSNNVATPPDMSASSDLFATYRDTSSTLPSMGNGINGDYNIGGLADFDSLFGGTASNGLEDPNFLAQYLISPSPPAVGGDHQQQFKQAESSLTATAVDAMNKAAQGTKSPSPGDGVSPCVSSFDVDGLCSDFTAKAVCREAAKQALKQAMSEDAQVTERLYGSSN